MAKGISFTEHINKVNEKKDRVAAVLTRIANIDGVKFYYFICSCNMVKLFESEKRI